MKLQDIEERADSFHTIEGKERYLYRLASHWRLFSKENRTLVYTAIANRKSRYEAKSMFALYHLFEIANLAKRVGDFDTARKYYERTLDEAIEIDCKWQAGDVCVALGRLSDAIEFYKDYSPTYAADLAKKLGRREQAIELYLKDHMFDEAWKLAGNNQEIKARINIAHLDHMESYGEYYPAARLARDLGHEERCKSICEKAIKKFFEDANGYWGSRGFYDGQVETAAALALLIGDKETAVKIYRYGDDRCRSRADELSKETDIGAKIRDLERKGKIMQAKNLIKRLE